MWIEPPIISSAIGLFSYQREAKTTSVTICKQAVIRNIVFQRHIVYEVNIPVTGRGGPKDCERSRLPHFLKTVGSQIAVRLSDLRAGRPLPPRKIPGTHFC
jgi:hypothetical protein